MQRAVAEAIDTVAAPARSAEVLALALSWARCEQVPESGLAVADFVEGALYRAAEELLGPENAGAIRDQLAPLVEMVAYDEVSSVRPSTPGLHPTPLDDGRFFEQAAQETDDFPELTLEAVDDEDDRDAPTPSRPLFLTGPAPGRVPMLFVASRDPTAVQQISAALMGVAAIEPVTDALGILEQLGEGDVLVIDCESPSVGLGTLLALAPELPKDARVVLWREREDQHEQLAGLGAGMPSDWVCCGFEAGPDDVATVCRVLFE